MKHEGKPTASPAKEDKAKKDQADKKKKKEKKETAKGTGALAVALAACRAGPGNKIQFGPATVMQCSTMLIATLTGIKSSASGDKPVTTTTSTALTSVLSTLLTKAKNAFVLPMPLRDPLDTRKEGNLPALTSKEGNLQSAMKILPLLV